jgi:hypothetical protein
MKTRFRFMVVGCLVVVLNLVAGIDAAERWPAINCRDSEAVQRIRSALDDETRIGCIETPLDQMATYLSEQHDIPILLDSRALDDAGIGTDSPVTVEIKGVSLRSGLRLLLRGLDLDFAIVDEVLLITVPQVASRHTEVCIYNVAELIRGDGDAVELARNLEEIFSVPACGGTGSRHQVESANRLPAYQPTLRIVPSRQLLIVRATNQIHYELAETLAALGRALGELQSEESPAAIRP